MKILYLIMTKDTLAIHDGFLCLKSVDTASDKPEFIVRYYRMFACSLHAAQYNGFPIGCRMVRDGHGYTPDWQDPLANGCRLRFDLEFGGQTISSQPEFLPIEQPKSTKPIRWYYGQWQKMLKQGWVNLGVRFDSV